jgi:hypothetical protein
LRRDVRHVCEHRRTRSGGLSAYQLWPVRPLSGPFRRFLLHVLPSGFYRIITTVCSPAVRARNVERVGRWLAAAQAAPRPSPAEADSQAEDVSPARRCPCCGGRMIIVETFEGPRPSRSPSPTRIRIDTS